MWTAQGGNIGTINFGNPALGQDQLNGLDQQPAMPTTFNRMTTQAFFGVGAYSYPQAVAPPSAQPFAAASSAPVVHSYARPQSAQLPAAAPAPAQQAPRPAPVQTIPARPTT